LSKSKWELAPGYLLVNLNQTYVCVRVCVLVRGSWKLCTFHCSS